MAYFRNSISLLIFALFGCGVLVQCVIALPKFPFGPTTSPSTPPPNTPTPLCPQGLSFKAACNNCFCNPATGVTGCTLMACPTLEPMSFYQNVASQPGAPVGSTAPRAPPPPAAAPVSSVSVRAPPPPAAAPPPPAAAPPPPAAPRPAVAADYDQEEDEEEDAYGY